MQHAGNLKIEIYNAGVSVDNLIFRRATQDEMPRILAMQEDVFSGEQGIPADDIDTFMAKKPICCAPKQMEKSMRQRQHGKKIPKRIGDVLQYFRLHAESISVQLWREFHLMIYLIWALIKYIWMQEMLP